MGSRRRWSLFVDVIAVAWLCLFAVDVSAGAGLFALAPGVAEIVRTALRGLFVVFVVDLAVLYHWSDEAPREFLRSRWFLILTVIPWFRPLRLLRAGRGLRALRLLAGSRRVGSLYNKVRRMGHRLWDRLWD